MVLHGELAGETSGIMLVRFDPPNSRGVTILVALSASTRIIEPIAGSKPLAKHGALPVALTPAEAALKAVA
jgi:GTP cyclohydrolase III